MKKILILIIGFLPLGAFAQSYNVMTYHTNDGFYNGIKIKTNIPIASEQMPTIRIEGYDAGINTTIGLNIGWYASGNGTFETGMVSSMGGYAYPVYLSVENGKVQLWVQTLNGFNFFTRLKITAFAQGFSEDSTWFKNWQIVDENRGGTQQTPLMYYNLFRDYVGINGELNVYGSSYLTGTISLNGTTTAKKITATEFVSIASNNNGYYGASANNHLMQNAYYDHTAGGWKAHASKASNGSAVVIQTEGKAGKALNILVDTTVGTSNEALTLSNLMTLTTSGNLGLGTGSPAEKLSVNGNILSKKVKVTQTGWADYVFEPSYKLPPLAEVEQFIKRKKHLPDVPSAEQIQREGNDLGETQVILLKKIEELTLYVIDQNKRIQLLESQLQQANKGK